MGLTCFRGERVLFTVFSLSYERSAVVMTYLGLTVLVHLGDSKQGVLSAQMSLMEHCNEHHEHCFRQFETL